MNNCKKIIIDLLNENKIITVKLSPEGDSPAMVKNYIESLNLSSNDKTKFNKDLVNGFKEYKIDMSKCAVEIEKETAKLNKFWESKLNKILQQGETREAEYQVQLSEYQVQLSEYRTQQSKNQVQLSEYQAQQSEYQAQQSKYQAQQSKYQNHIKKLQIEIDNMKQILTKKGFEKG